MDMPGNHKVSLLSLQFKEQPLFAFHKRGNIVSCADRKNGESIGTDLLEL